MKYLFSKPLAIAVSIGLLAISTGCSDDDNDTTVTPPTPPTTEPRFEAVISTDANGGGELLVDSSAQLTWINDVTLDTRGDGCVSPGNVGPTEPAIANERCENQQFGGFTDWRAPTAAELTVLITAAGEANAQLKYLVAGCPALVGSDGIVRTENAGNPAVAASFPNANAGDVLGAVLADLNPTGQNPVPAGVRCVRDGIEAAPNTPASARFSSVVATAADGGGESLIDSDNNLEWVNDVQLDTNGDGCVSPGEVGPTEPSQANARCTSQTFGGHDDWRAPSYEELSVLIKDAGSENVTLKYLVAGCPALVGNNGIVRTENIGNPAVAASFPNANAGDLLGSVLADLNPTGQNPVPAGVRCVRDIQSAQPRFTSVVSNANVGGGETVVDSTTSLEWISDTQLDTNGEGCVNPANSGPTEPSAADARCVAQSYAGHSDWRAPTAAELTELTTSVVAEGFTLKYLNPACPALVGTDGIVRTENANPTAASAFPNAGPGDILGTALSALPGGVNAGVRCVRSTQ